MVATPDAIRLSAERLPRICFLDMSISIRWQDTNAAAVAAVSIYVWDCDIVINDDVHLPHIRRPIQITRPMMTASPSPTSSGLTTALSGISSHEPRCVTLTRRIMPSSP